MSTLEAPVAAGHTTSRRVDHSDEGLSPAKPIVRRRKSGLWSMLIALVGLVGVAAAASRYFSSSSQGLESAYVVSPVQRSTFLVTVTEDGNLESASNVELKCEVEGGTTILEIVPDGSLVKKGDQLALLDSSLIEENLNLQKNAVGKAEATMISAKNDYEAAKISVQEYVEGTYLQSLQTIEADITIARQNLTSSENISRHSEEMVRKGYTTPQQHESNVYAVKKARLDLEKQLTAKKVLEDFTKVKTQKDLESKRDTAEAKMKSEIAAYDLESAKLRRLEGNLKKCKLVAPQDGMVVYANDTGGGRGGQQTPKIELGAAVRQYQAVLRLPDLSHMQVKVLVHESKIEELRPGQRARVKIQDRELQGTVTQVASQPEASQWFGGGAKEYATYVKIDGQPDGLKPGMTAEATILIDEKKNVLTVPVQCVVGKGTKSFAWVQSPTGEVASRELLIGATNDQVIEVKDGLKEGELVLQNPRSDVPEAQDEAPAEEKIDAKKAFGSATPATGTAAAPGPAAGSPAAGPAPGGPGTAAPGGPGGKGGGSKAGAGRRPGLPPLKDLDKNGDGKVSQDELPEQAQRMFEFMDTNKDSFVDAAEYKAAQDRARQMQRSGGGRGGPGGPGGGPGGGPSGGPGGPGGGPPR